MNEINTFRDLNDCGCCEGLTAQTPVEIFNRPGLAAIAYRVGTHATFKASMSARLSASDLSALAALKTREDDDFSIALLDAWATVADVLTFYQERIANESYLRTATERLSLLEMARLIGYELRAGVAASTLLAFTLDATPGAPRQATIDIGVKAQSVPGPGENAQTFETTETIEARAEWNVLRPQMTAPQRIGPGTRELYLNGINTLLQAGDAILLVGGERLSTPAGQHWDFRILQSVETEPQQNRTRVTWRDERSARSARVAETNLKVFALRQRVALFGHNAPDWNTMTRDIQAAYPADDSTPDKWPGFSIQKDQLDLDAVYPKVLPDSWMVLSRSNAVALYRVRSITSVSRAQFTLSTKVTRVEPDTLQNLSGFGLRETTVFAASEELELANAPIFTPVTGDSITLSSRVDGLVKGHALIFSGKNHRSGEPISEAVNVLETEAAGNGTAGNVTKIFFTPRLRHNYERESLTIYANVVRATHGETVREVLGSGDAAQTYQRFTLRQPPITHISAATPSGAQSTLQVRVNDVLWHEVSTLFGQGPHDRVYTTQLSDDGTTTVQFGDGIAGARLPTGRDNVRATYRKGIGLEAMVKAEQISQLMTRPLGVTGVVNPRAASGADDPESLQDVRRNAPLATLTLDRVVSLRDYEDFTRAFGGIDKALATWTWEGRTRRVFITIAGPNGAEIKPDSDTFKYLLKALREAGDPFVGFCVKSYRPASFRVAAKVRVDADFETGKVLKAVEQALRAQFSFEARDFGRPVVLSEIIAAMQSVPGVIACDVDRLYRAGSTPQLNHRLIADRPAMGADGQVNSAELLTLDAAPLDALGVMP